MENGFVTVEDASAQSIQILVLEELVQNMERTNKADVIKASQFVEPNESDEHILLGTNNQTSGSDEFLMLVEVSEDTAATDDNNVLTDILTNHSVKCKVQGSGGYKNFCAVKTDEKTNKTLVAMNNKKRPVVCDSPDHNYDIPQVSHLSDDGKVFFQCMYCNVTFLSLAELQAHIPQHYKFGAHEKSSSCDVCHYHLDRLNDHFATGHCHSAKEAPVIDINPTEYSDTGEGHRCDLCGLLFDSKVAMMNHHNRHDKKTHQCALCPKKYQTKRTLQLHLFQCHQVGKAYACPKCDKVFSVPSLLKAHIYSHDKEKPFNCDICGKMYQTESLLKRHQATHNKRFTCSHCDRLFKCQLQLTRHLNSLKDIYEAECKECGKKFTSNYYLRSHMIIHQSDKDYQCTWCGAMFARSSQLKRHTLMHTGERKHICAICSKPFPTVSALNKHRRLHSTLLTAAFSCSKCGKTFTSESSMKIHYCRYSQFLNGDGVTAMTQGCHDTDAVTQGEGSETTE